MKKWLLAVLGLVVILGVVVVGTLHKLRQWGKEPMQLSTEARFDVAKGATLYQLASELQNRGWIDDARWLRWYARLTQQGHMIKAGEYSIPVGLSPQGFIEKIQLGDIIQYRVTLINGHTFAQFQQTLQADPVLVKVTTEWPMERFIAEFNIPYPSVEGLFYPDTYQFVKGDSDLDILTRAYHRMDQLLTEAWQKRSDNLPYENPYEALVMASIVEKETAVPSEYRTIAGVFVNRLNLNMRLQTDPTVIYGLGQEYQGNLTRQHLTTYTPYNTYRINGLPPTPIANAALPAIEAALHPAKTEDLYFVAKGDGSHHFSQTLEQHTKAVRQYQWQRRKDYRSTPKPSSSVQTQTESQ